MHKNQIGTLETISFRTSRYDADYKYPIEGIVDGTSVSHSSFRLIMRQTPETTALFEKYISGNLNLPYDEDLIDASTGDRLYAIYFSFWPQSENISIGTYNSRLCTYEHDCDTSALGSPMTYSSIAAAYFNADQETISPLGAAFGSLLDYTVTIPPTISLHVM